MFLHTTGLKLNVGMKVTFLTQEVFYVFARTVPVCPVCERIDDLVEPRITAGGFENASHNAGHS
jgi:hypothetical protein